MHRIACWTAILFLSLIAGPHATADDSPPVKRAKQLLAIVNGEDKLNTEQFIRSSYAPKFLDIRMEIHLGFLIRLRDQTRGLEFRSVESETKEQATIIARSRLTGDEVRLLVKVEPEPPHRINGIGRPPTTPDPHAPGHLSREEFEKQLDDYITTLTRNELFSGVVMMAEGDQKLFFKAYGPANRDFNIPNRSDTKFNLGSMNKMFTALAILQLAEQGKLSLDDPLSKFLPGYPTTEAAERIQIKHLLTHTSGLGSFFNPRFMDKSRAALRDIDAMLEIGREEKLPFEPGARWQYSNTGFLVLGKVIEKASGQSYFEYVRQHIYLPAGMTRTDCYDLDKVNPNLAVGYHKELHADGSVEWRNNLFEHVIRGGPAGGGYSTAEDLHRFVLALRDGKLLSPERTKEMLSPKPNLNSPEYGYGFQIFMNGAMAGHTGGFPGISSRLAFFPAKGPIVIILSNQSDGAPMVSNKIEHLASQLDPSK